MEELVWEQDAMTLTLIGCLDKHTVTVLWDNREAMFKAVKYVSLGRLTRLDSIGLASLINCSLTYHAKLIEIQKPQYTLIKLYNLEKVMEQHDDS